MRHHRAARPGRCWPRPRGSAAAPKRAAWRPPERAGAAARPDGLCSSLRGGPGGGRPDRLRGSLGRSRRPARARQRQRGPGEQNGRRRKGGQRCPGRRAREQEQGQLDQAGEHGRGDGPPGPPPRAQGGEQHACEAQHGHREQVRRQDGAHVRAGSAEHRAIDRVGQDEQHRRAGQRCHRRDRQRRTHGPSLLPAKLGEHDQRHRGGREQHRAAERRHGREHTSLGRGKHPVGDDDVLRAEHGEQQERQHGRRRGRRAAAHLGQRGGLAQQHAGQQCGVAAHDDPDRGPHLAQRREQRQTHGTPHRGLGDDRGSRGAEPMLSEQVAAGQREHAGHRPVQSEQHHEHDRQPRRPGHPRRYREQRGTEAEPAPQRDRAQPLREVRTQ